MKLADLFHDAGIPTRLLSGFADEPVLAVTQNSADATPGSLFVCIRGSRSDGHRFAADAYRNGCRLFLAEQPLNLPPDALTVLTDNTHAALGWLACAFYGHPSHALRLVGITGTKGKTTTALLLSQILNQNGVLCGYIGTNGISFAGTVRNTQNTTPDALTLQKTLREMIEAGCRAAVLEVSSQAILLDRVAGTTFRDALFTNFSPDHIGPGEHPDLDNYFACKHRLFTDFGAETLCCNADDPRAEEMVAGTSASRVISVSLEANAAFRAVDIKPICREGFFGQTMTVLHGSERTGLTLPLIGKANACDALLALAVARESFGIPTADAARALGACQIPGRSEFFRLPNRATAVIDYAHNAASLRQLLLSLREYRPRRLICLFGSVGERTELRRTELGKVAAELADLCILTSDNPGTEPPEQIIDEIASAFEGCETPYLKIPDRSEAIRRACALLKPGDLLVLAGKGHETYQLVGKEKVPFSERKILLESVSVRQ